MLVAVLLSALACPGAGQVYYRRYVRGALLITASLGIIAAVFVQTLSSMQEVIASMPPEQALSNLDALAQHIVSSNQSYFSMLTYAFTAVWVYGIVDALFVPKQPGTAGRPDEPGNTA